MKSLELNWVRKYDKSLVIPEVVFAPTRTGTAGCYYSPNNSEILIGEKHYPLNHGLIVVSTDYPEEATSNLAHEWRHHWQQHHGWGLDEKEIVDVAMLYENLSYDIATRKYFTSQPCEMDALRFQYKTAGIHEHWEKLFWKELHQ